MVKISHLVSLKLSELIFLKSYIACKLRFHLSLKKGLNMRVDQILCLNIITGQGGDLILASIW